MTIHSWRELAIGRMKEANLKLTPQRLKLIEVIEKLGYRHPSLNEVYDEIKKDFPTTSFSTLYSNLLLLKELNLIGFFSFEGETRLEANFEPHINVIHSSDGRITDINDSELVKSIEQRIKKKIRMVNVFVED